MLALLLAAVLSSEVVPTPGSRVRVRTSDGRTHVGTLADSDEGRLVLEVPQHGRVELPQTAVVRFEVSRRRSRADLVATRAGAGLLIGVGVGVLTGYVMGDDRCPPSRFWCFTGGQKAVALAAVLGTVGLTLGAVDGATASLDRWKVMERPSVRLQLSPVPRGVGAAVAVRF